MAHIVLMPQKGVSEESAIMSKWYVNIGDRVKVGQKIFALETGKAAFDVEAETDGEIIAFLCEEGDELLIEAPVCVIGKHGEKFEIPGDAKKAPVSSEGPEAASAPAAPAAPTVDVSASPAVKREGFIAASPRAKKLAEEAGADIAYISPTGPEGRIIERDVNKYLNNGRPLPEETAPEIAKVPIVSAPTALTVPAVESAEYEDKPVSAVRKAVAKNMMASLTGMAQLTLNASFDATAIMNFRKSVKASPEFGLDKLTIGDFVMFAVSRTLSDFPDLNANFFGDKMRYFKNVNLGFACDTEKGLLVPVIRNADKLSLVELSAATKTLAQKAQNGTLSVSEMAEGSFTVTNLGSFGIESFTPVINPPQTGILGVNTISVKVREVAGEIKTYQSMSLSLTFDHRALDGAPAARFLKALCHNLENFNLLLAK